MNAPCGQEDCGHTIERLVKALERRGCERGWPSGATCLTVGTEDDPLGAKVRTPIEARLRCPACAAIKEAKS